MKRASLPLSLHSFFPTNHYIVSPIWKAWCPLESGNFSYSLVSLLLCRAELHGRVASIIGTFPYLPHTPEPTPFPRPLLTFCQVQQDPHNGKFNGRTLLRSPDFPWQSSLLHTCSFLLWNLAFTHESMEIPLQSLVRMLGLWVSAFVCALPPCAFSGNLIRKKVKKKKKEEVKLPGNLIWTHEFTYHLHNIWELVSAVFWAGVQQWFSLVLWLLNSVKNLPAVQETQVQSMGWEDALEKGMATHPSTLAWRISWTEELGGLQSMGLQRVRHDWVTNTFTWFSLFTSMKDHQIHLTNQKSELQIFSLPNHISNH